MAAECGGSMQRKERPRRAELYLHNATFGARVKQQTDTLASCVHFYLQGLPWRTVNIGGPHSITERRVPELIPVLGSQPAGVVSHKPDGRLLLLSITLATLKRATNNFAAWWTEARQDSWLTNVWKWKSVTMKATERERQYADTTGTVLVPWAGHFQC